MNQEKQIAIIGGGVAGSTAALYLSKLGLNVTLFEKKEGLVSGPPFCHLHAGGNLYREISDEQCITLLHQSIDVLKFYPYGIDFRPTLIVTPTFDDQDPMELLPRLKLLQKEYEQSILNDPTNEVLGNPKEYYKLYNKDDILALKDHNLSSTPSTFDEWLIPVINEVNLDKVKWPIIMVQEYGWNLFRVGATIDLQLQNIPNCTTILNTSVTDVKFQNDQFTVTYIQDDEDYTKIFDYLINATGYLTGKIDDMLGFKRKRFVEFKAAYVTKWENDNKYWPEIIFHGKRGTPKGMGQFTPYPDGYFQLHGMTKDITLFENGLVQSNEKSAQPKLDNVFCDKLNNSWSECEVDIRTTKAIEHLTQFIPSFKNATVASKPLYGAQQIPGTDEDLRAADVSFEGDRYARCEVVKASSVLAMVDEIMKKLISLGFIENKYLYKRDFDFLDIDEDEVLKLAQEVCKQRHYPLSLADITTRREIN
jgi:hypothetical protein